MAARTVLVEQRPMIYRRIIGWPARRLQTISRCCARSRTSCVCVRACACVCQPIDAADKRPIYRPCFTTEFSRTSAPLRGGNSRPPPGISGLSLAWKKILSLLRSKLICTTPLSSVCLSFYPFLFLFLDFLPRFRLD